MRPAKSVVYNFKKKHITRLKGETYPPGPGYTSHLSGPDSVRCSTRIKTKEQVKYCDNPECPYVKRVNTFAEYRDECSTCSDCGSALKSGDGPERGIDSLDIDPLVNISSHRDLQDAYLVKARLESEGVKVFLRNEHTIGVQWLYSTALGGVKLDVLESQAEQAMGILQENYSKAIPDQHPTGSSDIQGICPKCNSTNTHYYDRARKYGAISLILSFPLILFGKRYRCLDCRHVWKPQ